MTFEITPEIRQRVDAERREYAAEVAAKWRDGLTYKDWLFDGQPIRGRVMIERFNNLDWPNAWIDMGPSVTGNPGPYWHVPLKETVIDGAVYDYGDTVHRLYPKIITGKWGLLILQACLEAQTKMLADNLAHRDQRESGQ